MNEQEKLFELWRTFDSFLDRAWIELNDITITLDSHSYLYAALDLRLSIEKLLSIILIAISSNELTKKQRSIYRVKDFVSEMRKENLNYEEIINTKIKSFTKDSDLANVPIFSINELNKIYGILGNLLHLNDSAEEFISDKERLDKIERIVLSSYEYLVRFQNVDFEKMFIEGG